MSQNEKSDSFGTGIFWELYLDLERQYEDFLEYVPYLPGNEQTYSFKLLNLILSIGGHVDSAFKEMARYPKFSGNPEIQEILKRLKESEKREKGEPPITIPIWLSLKAFEKEYGISKQEVIFKRLPEREKVVPFKPFVPETNEPEWWGIYNGLKHYVGVNLTKANLQTVMQALAGAFLLNVIHRPAILRLNDYDMIDGLGDIPEKQLEEMINRPQKLWGVLETELFVYDYEQWGIRK
jgi:hypothetical protein